MYHTNAYGQNYKVKETILLYSQNLEQPISVFNDSLQIDYEIHIKTKYTCQYI